MGNKEAKQDRKPSLENMATSSRETQTPSLQDIRAARQHKQSAEAGLRPAAQEPGHSSHTLSAQEAPTVPPLPSTARDDGVDKALRDATHVASRMQQQVGGGSYHTPEPLPGHPPGQPLKKEDADALRTGPGKGPPAGRLSTPYFGPASPSEPPMQGERAVGSDVLSKDQDARPSKLLTAGVPSMSGTTPTPGESSPASNARERASRYIKTGDDPTYDPVLRAKQQAAEALEHRMPPPYAHPHDADPQRPETSVYYEHGKKHVVHDGTDEVVMDHGSVPQAQKMKTPFAPEANLEQVSGVQELPKKEQQWKEAGPRAAEAASNLALKAVHSGEKAKEEVKEAIYRHEPVSLAPAQQKEQGATPRPGEPDSEPRSHEPAPAHAEGEDDDEPAWMKPMTPEAELYHVRYARSVQIPSPTPQQISPEEQIASEPYTSAEPAPAAGSEGGLLDTFIMGITSGVDKLLGRGHEREEDKIPVSQVLDPVDTPYPGDQEASSPDELSGHVPAPGIVIGPTQGGPCLGSVPEAEDAASRMRPASPTEPPAFSAQSAEEAAVPPVQLPQVASGVIVCSETGWSGPHLDELSSHLRPGIEDSSAEGKGKTLKWAEATAEAAGVSVPHSQAGDEAFALAARGALGMDDDSPTPAK